MPACHTRRQLTARTGSLLCSAILLSHLSAFGDDRPDAKRESRDAKQASVPTYFSQPKLTGVLGNWWTIGTVAKSANGDLTVGDYVGYDTADVDHDGNPETVWYFGSPSADIGSDSDGLVSRRGYTGNVTLSFKGCIPNTTQSYHWVVLFEPNQNFTGVPGSAFANSPAKSYAIGFATRWEQTDGLFIWQLTQASGQVFTPVPIASKPAMTASGFCANYKVMRKKDRLLAYINGSKVFDAPTTTGSVLSAQVRTFERPAIFSSITLSAGQHEDDSDSGSEPDESRHEHSTDTARTSPFGTR